MELLQMCMEIMKGINQRIPNDQVKLCKESFIDVGSRCFFSKCYVFDENTLVFSRETMRWKVAFEAGDDL